MRARHERTRRVLRRTGLPALALCLLALPAACGGSALDPATVRAANDAVEARVAGSGGTTSPGAVPGTAAASSAGSAPSHGHGGGHRGGVPAARGAAGGVGGSAAGATGSGGGAHAATGGGHQASCAGFRNQTGVTGKTITIANASDISGPVPGIFESAQQATKAYVAYFNVTSSICGRKLRLIDLDTRTDAGANQQAYETACHQAFAAVGSMSAFDSGGASTAQDCGLPDLRSMAISDTRNACRTCFGAQAVDLNTFEDAVPDFFLAHDHAATQHAAMLWVNAAVSAQNAHTQIAVEKQRGMRFVYTSSFDVSEFNYGPYVQQMKEKGVRWLQFVGSTDEAVRLAKAMQNASFKPEVFLLDPTSYNQDFVRTGGSAVDGAYVFLDFTPFEEVRSNPELRLYESWLQQVAPGAQPTYFGLFAWSASRLFAQEAAALGGRLTRAALVSRIRGVKAWTSNGLHAPQPVGPKQTSPCWRFVRLQHGRWVPVGGRQYLCRAVSRAG